MFPLLLISNRTYLKLPWYTLSRHLSTVERRIYEPFVLTTVHRNLWSNSIQINQWEVFTNEYYQKRYMILNTPSTTEEKSSSNKNERMPFQFPPGNPNDKPKLEHLCFIENQLIQIVNVRLILSLTFSFSCNRFCFSYLHFLNKCIHMLYIQLI